MSQSILVGNEVSSESDNYSELTEESFDRQQFSYTLNLSTTSSHEENVAQNLAVKRSKPRFKYVKIDNEAVIETNTKEPWSLVDEAVPRCLGRILSINGLEVKKKRMKNGISRNKRSGHQNEILVTEIFNGSVSKSRCEDTLYTFQENSFNDQSTPNKSSKKCSSFGNNSTNEISRNKEFRHKNNFYNGSMSTLRCQDAHNSFQENAINEQSIPHTSSKKCTNFDDYSTEYSDEDMESHCKDYKKNEDYDTLRSRKKGKDRKSKKQSKDSVDIQNSSESRVKSAKKHDTYNFNVDKFIYDKLTAKIDDFFNSNPDQNKSKNSRRRNNYEIHDSSISIEDESHESSTTLEKVDVHKNNKKTRKSQKEDILCSENETNIKEKVCDKEISCDIHTNRRKKIIAEGANSQLSSVESFTSTKKKIRKKGSVMDTSFSEKEDNIIVIDESTKNTELGELKKCKIGNEYYENETDILVKAYDREISRDIHDSTSDLVQDISDEMKAKKRKKIVAEENHCQLSSVGNSSGIKKKTRKKHNMMEASFSEKEDNTIVVEESRKKIKFSKPKKCKTGNESSGNKTDIHVEANHEEISHDIHADTSELMQNIFSEVKAKKRKEIVAEGSDCQCSNLENSGDIRKKIRKKHRTMETLFSEKEGNSKLSKQQKSKSKNKYCDDKTETLVGVNDSCNEVVANISDCGMKKVDSDIAKKDCSPEKPRTKSSKQLYDANYEAFSLIDDQYQENILPIVNSIAPSLNHGNLDQNDTQKVQDTSNKGDKSHISNIVLLENINKTPNVTKKKRSQIFIKNEWTSIPEVDLNDSDSSDSDLFSEIESRLAKLTNTQTNKKNLTTSKSGKKRKNQEEITDDYQELGGLNPENCSENDSSVEVKRKKRKKAQEKELSQTTKSEINNSIGTNESRIEDTKDYQESEDLNPKNCSGKDSSDTVKRKKRTAHQKERSLIVKSEIRSCIETNETRIEDTTNYQESGSLNLENSSGKDSSHKSKKRRKIPEKEQSQIVKSEINNCDEISESRIEDTSDSLMAIQQKGNENLKKELSFTESRDILGGIFLKQESIGENSIELDDLKESWDEDDFPNDDDKANSVSDGVDLDDHANFPEEDERSAEKKAELHTCANVINDTGSQNDADRKSSISEGVSSAEDHVTSEIKAELDSFQKKEKGGQRTLDGFVVRRKSTKQKENAVRNLWASADSVTQRQLLVLDVIEEEKEQLESLQIDIPWDIPLIHKIACYVSRSPTPQQRKDLENAGLTYKTGKFNKQEDKIIKQNWRTFCELHKWDEDKFRPFARGTTTRTTNGVLSKEQRLKFAKFISHGIEDRLIYNVYARFQRIFSDNENSRRFTKKEDKILLEYVLDGKSTTPYSDLAMVLNKSRTAIQKRYELLQSKYKTEVGDVFWTQELTEQLLANIIETTCSVNLQELKDRVITPQEWNKISKNMNIPTIKLKRAWLVNFHPRFFISNYFEKVTETKQKLLELLNSRYSDWRAIDWNDVAKEFDDGFTSTKLCKMVNDMVAKAVPTEKRRKMRKAIKYLLKRGMGKPIDRFGFIKEIMKKTENGTIIPKINRRSKDQEKKIHAEKCDIVSDTESESDSFVDN